MKKINWKILGCIVLLSVSAFSVGLTFYHSNQASSAMILQAAMEGEYKIGDGAWQPIVRGEHIPANKGDVTMRGTLQMTFPDGEVVGPVQEGDMVTMRMNHIGGSVYIDGEKVYDFDAENSNYGNSTCGDQWIIYNNLAKPGQTTKFVFHNPHKFGNAFAIDTLFDSMSMYTGKDFEFQKDDEMESKRIIAFGLIFTALGIIGVALFAFLIKLKENELLWGVGLTTLFAGSYFALQAKNVYIWNEDIAITTTAMIISIFLYVFFFQSLIPKTISGKAATVSYVCNIITGVFTFLLILYAALVDVKLYDMANIWGAVQLGVCSIHFGCCLSGLKYATPKNRLTRVAVAAALSGVVLDLLSGWLGWWNGPICSELVFWIIFGVALILVLQILPKSIRAGMQEQEMRAELEKSKTAVMLSQIQPHFLYNSLGAIRELIRQDPDAAREAMTTFIAYLRGNVDALQKENVIHFTKELKHISAYLELEEMRFGEDLTVVYDVKETDFFIPSLTIQPLVENAVKHGICGREEGGTITLHTYRADQYVYVVVEDDGIGFDTSQSFGKDHVGLANVRERVKSIVDGKLEVESTPGAGTKVTMIINTEER